MLAIRAAQGARLSTPIVDHAKGVNVLNAAGKRRGTAQAERLSLFGSHAIQDGVGDTLIEDLVETQEEG
jgi:hypothetical protein